jgi:glycosyltransferase involved in cell wall biosynthesis
MSSPSFVVFSDDWGEHMSSSQHLFRRIAEWHDVLWVNTIGMRRPRLTMTDMRKAWRKASRMWSSRGGQPARGNDSRVAVCQPLMLPFSGFRAVRAFNTRSVTWAVEAAVKRADLAGQIIVSTVPNAGDYRGLFRDSTVVYYCVDDFAEWPGLDRERVRQMEERLIARADMLVATSAKLYDRLRASGKPTHLLTHGVDIELFSQQAAAEHACLAGIPKPRAGFFGLFDGRTDQNLIASLADRMPDFSFVFSGPIESPTDRLAAHRNVHFTGPVSYEELPSLIKGLDVLFIPYLTGDFADALSPLKLKEYLVTGKPIVSTPIAEARSRSAYVSVADTVPEWESALRGALAADAAARRQVILPTMTAESWAYKAQSLLQICTSAALERSGLPDTDGSRSEGARGITSRRIAS